MIDDDNELWADVVKVGVHDDSRIYGFLIIPQSCSPEGLTTGKIPPRNNKNDSLQ